MEFERGKWVIKNVIKVSQLIIDIFGVQITTSVKKNMATFIFSDLVSNRFQKV